MIEHPLVLEGTSVRLEPLALRHIPDLLAIAGATPELFRYTSTPTTPTEAEAYFGRAFSERDRGVAYPFVLLSKGEDEGKTEKVVGTSRFADIRPAHRGCELGFTWLAPQVRGTAVNLESKYLMLRHAFERLDFLRVYFYTDARNTRSQRAILKLGATYEGTLRAERVMQDGFVRDTLLYSVIHSEWADVRARLEARLTAKLAAAG